jgi:hypothetical protein
MADNMTPTSTFATANMKPAAAGGENIDSVWGRNVGDNLAFLYGRGIPHYYPDIVGSANHVHVSGKQQVVATVIMNKPFYRIPGHNTLTATMTVRAKHRADLVTTFDNYGTLVWGIFGDLGTYAGTLTYQQTNTAAYDFESQFATTIPLSNYSSNGSWAGFYFKPSGTTTDPDGPAGFMAWEMVDIKMHSSWA